MTNKTTTKTKKTVLDEYKKPTVKKGKHNNNPFLLVIRNTLNEVKRAHLFGSSMDDVVNDTYFKSDKGIEINCAGTVTYKQMLGQTASVKYKINKIVMYSSNEQVAIPVQVPLKNTDANGCGSSAPLFFKQWSNRNIAEADGSDFYNVINDIDHYDINVLPNTTIVLHLFCETVK